MQISKGEFGKQRWPFTLLSGTLRWELSSRHLSDGTPIPYLLFDGDDGKIYALNGAARAVGIYDDYHTIWRDNPQRKGEKLSIAPIMTLSLELLEQQHPEIYQAVAAPSSPPSIKAFHNQRM